MPKNVSFLIFGLVVAVAVGAYFLFSKTKTKILAPQITPPISQTSESATVHEHASFAIFTNGLKRDFGDPKYHQRLPGARLYKSNPEVIHKHEFGVTWGNFFDSLPMKLTNECLTAGTGQTFCTSQNATLKFYMNGQKVDDFLRREIKDSDRALITYGKESETQIKSQLSQVGPIEDIYLDPKE